MEKRLENEYDTAHVEVEDFEVKKKMDIDHENPLFTKWCEERKDNFDVLLEETKRSSVEEHAPEAEKSNKVPPERVTLMYFLWKRRVLQLKQRNRQN